MRICLLGSTASDQLDEGMRNVAHHLSRELAKRHEILTLDPRCLREPKCLKEMHSFKPHIIHNTSGPSIFSLILLKGLRFLITGSRVVVSAVHPWFPRYVVPLIRFFRPDLVLAPSQRVCSLFEGQGCRVAFLANGVDLDRFRPVSGDEKRVLREQFGLPLDEFIILHVGSVKARRGIEALTALQHGDQQVLMIGSTSTGHERNTIEALRKRGCFVWLKYFEEIQQIYALSDCFVFPTWESLSAIEVPLSVLEAMACNLPVISTTFGGLPELFQEGDGLVFYQSNEELLPALVRARTETVIRTRQKLVGLGWEQIVEQLEGEYAKLETFTVHPKQSISHTHW